MKRQKKETVVIQKPKNPKSASNKIQTQSKIMQPELPLNVWVLAGLIITVGLIAFYKYLTLDYLFFFKDIGSDSINQNYPGLVHNVNMLKEGFFSEWSFYKGMGQNFETGLATEPYGLLRQGIDYISAIKYGSDSLIFSRFIKIFIYDFLFGGIITFLYFRTLSVKKFSAFIGALLITFSGYMVVGSGWGFSSHIFKAMFLLFAFEQLYLNKRWYFFPFAVIWLSSNVFVLYIYTVFLIIYSLFRFFSEKENKISQYIKLALKMLLLGLIGFLMNIRQLIVSFTKMYNSPRVSGNASYSDILSSGKEIAEQTDLGASTILRFYSSDVLGTGNKFQGWNNYLESPLFYIGLFTLLIAPQVFIHLSKRKKIIFGIFAAIWTSTLFIPYFRYAFLAFTGDYFRYGFDFFIPFTLLFFAIYALNELDKKFKINIILLSATILILLTGLFYPYNSIPENALNINIRNAAALLIIAYSIMLLLLSKPKYKKIAQIGIILLLLAELSYFSYTSYADREPVTKQEFKTEKAGYNDGTIEAVNYIKEINKTAFYRTEKDYQSGSAVHSSLNDALAQGYFGTTSYSSFNQLNYVRFLEETGLIQKGDETATRWLTGFRNYPLLQTFGNVKYHLSKSENPEFLKFGFDSIARIKGITVLKNRYALPFAYTYDKYIDYEDFKSLISYQISEQTLSNLYQDLSRNVEFQELNTLINKLQELLNINFPNENLFTNALKTNIGTDNTDRYLLTIKKYSVSNFKNQIALLSGFVYEKYFNKSINIDEFEKINPNDTSIIVPAVNFNFNRYKKITDELKQDSLQITDFTQSTIKGKISLRKTKLLFFTIPFDDGWKIKINDKKTKLSRINIGFTGIILPEGNHTIELYYIPKYSQLSNLISFIAILGFWSFLIYFFIKKKKLKRI